MFYRIIIINAIKYYLQNSKEQEQNSKNFNFFILKSDKYIKV